MTDEQNEIDKIRGEWNGYWKKHRYSETTGFNARTDAEVDWLRQQLALARLDLSAERQAHEQTKINLKQEIGIVNRIWDLFGSPSYQELQGRSIYDLINEVKEKLQVAEKQMTKLHDSIVFINDALKYSSNYKVDEKTAQRMSDIFKNSKAYLTQQKEKEG